MSEQAAAGVRVNVYGHGDGSEMPQMHVVDATEGRDAAASFFHAYERYFNDRWNTAEHWDFQAYL